MKIILSRKGFDSRFGGVPSPILPNGQMLSLPIPSEIGCAASHCENIEPNIVRLANDLTHGRIGNKTLIHVDPDLTESTLPRMPGWRPLFGQDGAAQSHLANQKIGSGDLFLFFGWYRHVQFHNGRWRYLRNCTGFHSLFGWMQVGEVIDVDAVGIQNLPTWACDHPHVRHAEVIAGQHNTLYVASDKLALSNNCVSTPGAGVFSQWTEALKLTAPGQTRSVWRVPLWLEPKNRPPLTYHTDPTRWTHNDGELHLRSVPIGQEFVLDTDYYPEAIRWALNIIDVHKQEVSH